MEAKDFRRLARERLNGRWGEVAILSLIYGLVYMGISLVSSFIPLGSLLAYVVVVPLGFGYLCQLIAVANGKQIEYGNLFKFAINNFSKIWGVTLRMCLKFLGPIVLMIVGCVGLVFSGTISLIGSISIGSDTANVVGLIISLFFTIIFIAASIWTIPLTYKYKFCLNELVYNPNETSKEIVERSGNLMVGKRLGEFWLELTFIGWSMLGSIALCIPFLWITPYLMISTALYYEWASGRLNEPTQNPNPMQNPTQNPVNNYGYYQG